MRSNIFGILAFVLAVGIYFAYINPEYTGTVASTQAAIAGDNQALAAAASYTQKQNELAAERDQISPDSLARLSSFLPSSVDNVGIILDLNALASRSGLSLSSINVANGGANSAASASTGAASSGPITADSALNSVDLTLSGTGTYAQFRAFLAGLESSQRLLDVTSLAVRGTDTGVYTYALTIRLYWLP